MKKYILLSLAFISLNLYSQNELYMPIEFKKAYKEKTRSFDGNPGPNYWQNSSSYLINAEIKPGDWKITGSLKIVYTNNSPDSLSVLIIKTYPNHYKKGSARAYAVPEETITKGMKISNFTIDGNAIDLIKSSSVEIKSTFIKIQLTKPIAPKTSANLAMNWSTEMPPLYTNRIGAYDQSTVFVGYWYPQIASYNDIDGWDEMEYMGSQEFNTDFSDYNVTIKTPSTYKVWATGELQNPKDVFTPEELEEFNAAKTSKELLVISPGGNNSNRRATQNSWNFKANNVKDFAFAVSDNFRWISNAVNIGDKVISSNIVYDKSQSKSLERLLSVQEESLNYLSSVYPGIEYPYPQFTTFVGVTEFDGMEFPMMANNGISTKEVENTDVTFHELAHSYFPFLMGINEVKYSWMEEGWTEFFTIKFIQYYNKGTIDENAELNRMLNSYNKNAGLQWDAPLIMPSFLLTYSPAHDQLSYRKPAFMYLTLENILGEDIFKKCLKTYINRWRGKHPTPYDFMFTFNEISNQNLNWFWKAWIFEPGYGDLGLEDIESSKLKVKNIGGLPVPIILRLTYKNGIQKTITKTATIWNETKNNIVDIDIDNANGLLIIELVTDYFPDADEHNNILKIKQ